MVARLEVEGLLGADLFDDGEVLFATGWDALDDYVLDLPDQFVDMNLCSVGNL